MPLALIDARETESARGWLENVYPLYLHELSEFDAGAYVLDENGRFEPDYLPYWLREASGRVLVLEENRRYQGFALVGTASFPYKSPDVDHRLSEFFVTRSVRGTGWAETAARVVFDHLPGTWEVAELPANQRAVRFWRRIIHRYTNGGYTETVEPAEIRQVFTAPANR